MKCDDALTKQRLMHEAKYNGVGGSERGLNLQLYSGKPFYPCDPRVEDIDINDIAHALSLTNRFGGHTEFPLSVAQHSVNLSYLVSDENKFCALMHDATEYILGDIIRPIKYMLPDFIEMEDRLWSVIALKYGLPAVIPDEVKDNDVRITFTEKRDCLSRSVGTNWGYEIEPHDFVVEPWGWVYAKKRFLDRFEELYEG